MVKTFPFTAGAPRGVSCGPAYLSNPKTRIFLYGFFDISVTLAVSVLPVSLFSSMMCSFEASFPSMEA